MPSRAGALFSYAVPTGMALSPGSVVVVPFSSRVLPGVVVRVTGEPPGIPTRDVLAVVEDAPRLAAERVEVAEWIARYYRCPLFDALSLFLPPGWARAVAERPGAGPRRWVFEWPAMPISEATVVAVAAGGGATQGRGDGETGGRGEKGVPAAGTARGRVLALLASHGPTAAGRVAKGAGCTLATVQRMIGEGWLVVVVRPHPDPLPGGEGERGGGPHPDPLPLGEGVPPLPRGEGRGEGRIPLLNPAQVAAFAAIADALERRRHQVFLLHGVTGSGKTHVYLRLIDALVGAGRRAIVLVSEIAQTPEALERYAERFPGRVALLHSELPEALRWHLWRGVQEGRFDVVIGPRSALFAPVPDLGLVVLDEEHEPAYKQDAAAPRYHAREVAIELGRRSGAAVVLGSATPDVGSYFLAEQGVYRLLSLPERYAGPSARGWSGGDLPRVEVVDLREELRAGNRSLLGRSLQSGLERVLAAGEQAILFLNRRGSATSVVCRDCGFVVKCRRCDVPLVFHREPGEMVCHQCNRRMPPPAKCPECRKPRISFFGAGTERVEEEVRRLLPSARVLRWDHDVAGRRDAHARIHRQFQEHQADVLVGTQMVAKALDFPLVTLVGVVLADITLHLPDFRAAERTFQLLAQVAGRAGRGAVAGRVIIQTFSPTHYSVLAAAGHDYRAFYEQELAFRRRHLYPPFRRLARLLYAGAGEARARFEVLQMRQRLQAKVDELGIGDVAVMGPAPAFHSRVRSRYRWQIVLAGEGLPRLLEEVPLPLGWGVDVEPVSLL